MARSFRGGGRFREMRRSTAAALVLLLACLDARGARAAGDAVRHPGWHNGVYLNSGATQRLRGASGLGGGSAGGGVNTGALGSTTASTAAVGAGASFDAEDTGGLPVPGTIHVDPSKVMQISWEPRAYLYRGFLRSAECDYIIQTSAPQLRKSTVVDNDTGKSVPSAIRTSDGSFIARGADETIADGHPAREGAGRPDLAERRRARDGHAERPRRRRHLERGLVAADDGPDVLEARRREARDHERQGPPLLGGPAFRRRRQSVGPAARGRFDVVG